MWTLAHDGKSYKITWKVVQKQKGYNWNVFASNQIIFELKWENHLLLETQRRKNVDPFLFHLLIRSLFLLPPDTALRLS